MLRTPLVRFDTGPGGPDIRLKLENLQPTNSYKIRGAPMRSRGSAAQERARGVWTVSAGNAGQAIAFAARAAGIPCTVVAIETAPQTKLDRMAALGARIVPVPYEVAWQAVTDHAFEGMDGTFIHPFDNHDFIAGHATMGLEILEDAPDVRAVIAAIGGGGLITGVGSAIKALRPEVTDLRCGAGDGGALRLVAARGRAAALPGLAGLVRRRRRRPEPDPAHVGTDAAVVDGAIIVSLDQTRAAMRSARRKARVIAEGAGALSLAAALTGEAGEGPIVCVMSGGNIDLAKFCALVAD